MSDRTKEKLKDTESKKCKSCTHQGEKAMTGKCFTCYDYENYEGSGDKQTCDNCGQDHKYCEPTNKEQFGFCGNWAEHSLRKLKEEENEVSN